MRAYSATVASTPPPVWTLALACSSSLESMERSRRTVDISVCSCMLRSFIIRFSSFTSWSSCNAEPSMVGPPLASSADRVPRLCTRGGAFTAGSAATWAMRLESSMMEMSCTCRVAPFIWAWLSNCPTKTEERFTDLSSSSRKQARTCWWYVSRRTRASAQLKIAPSSESRSVMKSFFCTSMPASAASRLPLQKVANLATCAVWASFRSMAGGMPDTCQMGCQTGARGARAKTP
mmetsp:Transcript_58954/g.132673  ORF Transcript_58954/g.132673 Transcript_58954/m.132673 type:complete len:234 (+) Transcript_58954:401-1102(+)